jgi:hypothetical protein
MLTRNFLIFSSILLRDGCCVVREAHLGRPAAYLPPPKCHCGFNYRNVRRIELPLRCLRERHPLACASTHKGSILVWISLTKRAPPTWQRLLSRARGHRYTPNDSIAQDTGSSVTLPPTNFHRLHCSSVTPRLAAIGLSCGHSTANP